MYLTGVTRIFSLRYTVQDEGQPAETLLYANWMDFMRTLLSSVLALGACVLLATPLQAAPTQSTLDADRSRLTFVSDAPGERIVGSASNIEGSIQWDLDHLAGTTADIRFPVRSMETGNRLRDRHLVGRQWLDADAHSHVRLEVTGLESIEREDDGEQVRVQAVARGFVTVRGERAPMQARVQVVILPARGAVRIQPTLTIRLADHNVEGQRGVIGDKVGETIDIEGLLYATTP